MTIYYRMDSEPVLPYNVTIPNVLDYTKATYYINSKLGFDQRDAGRKYFNPTEPLGYRLDKPYLDYWHYVLEKFGEFRNDSYVDGTVSFLELYREIQEECGNDDWRTSIARVWAQTYPGRYTLWMSW